MRIPDSNWPLTLLAVCVFGLCAACGGGYAPQGEQWLHFENAIARTQESLSATFTGTPDELRALRQSALEDAQQVDPENLKGLHTAMPRYFRGALVRGLSLWVQGAAEDDPDLLQEGELAVSRWEDWYRAAQREISR